MGPRILLFLLVAFIQIFMVAKSNAGDFVVLNALKDVWQNTPANWHGPDPCGSHWEGIGCTNSNVISITLSSVDLIGQLSGDITFLSELVTLDLSSNKGLKGPLPTKIGSLKKLKTLNLAGCSFSGPIPPSIGSLQQLSALYLNSNGFTGPIPPEIGGLSELFVLDLTDNKLEGPIPISSGTTPGLDRLLKAAHFHMGKNLLSGTIPPQLFSADMTVIHVLFDNNKLTGTIPSTLGLVKTLEVLKIDGNSLSGPIPSNLNNLTNVNALFLSNNKFNGAVPDLSAMSYLSYLDMSNNSFDASGIPQWLSTLKSLTTLMMESTQLEGEVPTSVFSLAGLQTVVLSNNKLNGTLDIGTTYSGQLRVIDLQNNTISGYKQTPGQNHVDLRLLGNPICETKEATESYCSFLEPNSSLMTTQRTCMPSVCTSKQVSSPKCRCAYPFKGHLFFKPPSVLMLTNSSHNTSIEESLMDSFRSFPVPVDSINVTYLGMDSSKYHELRLEIFPSQEDHFNRTEISNMWFVLNHQTLYYPNIFGTSSFRGEPYQFDGQPSKGLKKLPSTGIILAAAGGSVLLLLFLLAVLYACYKMKRAERAAEQSSLFGEIKWRRASGNSSGGQLKGARYFSFEELKKATNNFSKANDVGSGAYGKVYKGILPSGQVIAIKRAKQGSMQGRLEFQTEIELLSRVHHKNVVSLLGFCLEKGEQMLIYEFICNGTLQDSLSGRSGINLNWLRRLRVALGVARGLAYLHELADPPIIHRDIKSTNVLLDEYLNAKIADFGLSKSMSSGEDGHVSTQVKGTMGYLDPEYHMSEHLTAKSDVYSFGVLMLELITGRRPLERGSYIVNEVRTALDRTKDYYNLRELIDRSMGLDTFLRGLDRFVDLSMKCVQGSGADRPAMGEVVKELEDILQLAGLNPNADSASSLGSYEELSKGSSHFG